MAVFVCDEGAYLDFSLESESYKKEENMGQTLMAPMTNKSTQFSFNEKYIVAVANMQGWRFHMEDAHTYYLEMPGDNETAYFSVFDGHGGTRVAKHASEHLHAKIVSQPEYKSRNLAEAIRRAFLSLDAEMQSAMTSSLAAEDDNRTTGPVELNSRPPPPNNPSDELAGSTGLVVLIRDDLVYCGNAGDSRAVVSRRGLDRKTDLWWDVPPKRDLVPKHRLMVGSPDVSGRNNPSRPKFLLASALSTDHKPTLVEERRRIVAAGGWVDANRVNGNLALSRALGDFVFKRNPQQAADQQIVSACPDVAVCRIDPAEDEFILLGCDGIWDVMTNQEVVSFVRARLAHGMHPVKICEDLMMRCLAPDCHTNGLGCDNMTVVLVCFLFNRPPIELQQRCARSCPGGAAVDVLAPD